MSNSRKILISSTFVLITVLGYYVIGQDKMNDSVNTEIRIIIGERVLVASLINNKTSRDFISLLPLELTLEDYAGTEKIGDLSKKLSTEDTPAGSDPSIGDITYYAPWGNLAIFYKDLGYANGLIILGKIENGMEVFHTSKSLNARIELIK